MWRQVTGNKRSAMIAQWENECISLSVLPVARVMLAQWENECISRSVLPVARVMLPQWENECISLSVLPVARVMLAQWENECTSLSVPPWPGFNSRQWRSISRDSSLADQIFGIPVLMDVKASSWLATDPQHEEFIMTSQKPSDWGKDLTLSQVD